MKKLKKAIEKKYGKKETVLIGLNLKAVVEYTNIFVNTFRLLKDDKYKTLGENEKKLKFISILQSYVLILSYNALSFWLKHKDNNYKKTKKLTVNDIVNEITK
ncbi:hypothetical protein Alsa1_CDS0209 [Staphylococcus phage Alsa_1]|nr:hypothetical protein Alsa1_CDS0209 [Staphylococcus phage Alsa_1]